MGFQSADHNVAQSEESVTLLTRRGRKEWTVRNDSEATLYVRLGAEAASTEAHMVAIAAGGYFEMPIDWDGPVQGIWSAAGEGTAHITEVL